MPRCHWLPHGWRQSRAVSVRVLRAEAVWQVADMCDIPGTKAAVGQSSALWREPREAECSRKDPAMPSLVAAPVWAAVAVGQRGGERPALGGHGWVPAAAPAHRSCPARSRAGSRPGSCPDLGMSATQAPDTQDPEEAGTCPEDVPSLKEIEQLLSTGRPSCNHVDEVWPNLFLGDL